MRTALRLQLPAGKATPAPLVGTALGPLVINIVEFTKSYNEKTVAQVGFIIPAQIIIFEDRSFTFILKTPPAADLLRKAAGVEKGSADRRARQGRYGHTRSAARVRAGQGRVIYTPWTSMRRPASSRTVRLWVSSNQRLRLISRHSGHRPPGRA